MKRRVHLLVSGNSSKLDPFGEQVSEREQRLHRLFEVWLQGRHEGHQPARGFTDRLGVTTNYQYDSIGRLKEADGVPTSATDYEYLYDPVGHWGGGECSTDYRFS